MQPKPSARILYYAFGGGLGHLNRTLAVIRQMPEAGVEHLVVTNCPHYPFVSEPIAAFMAAEGHSSLRIMDLASFESPEDVAQVLAVTIDDYQPDVLVVDTFPRGIIGELARILPLMTGCAKTLVSRNLPNPYIDEFQIAAFVEQHFDLVFGIEENNTLASVSRFCQVAPVVFPNKKEVSTSHPNIGATPKIAIVASGNPSEIERAKKLHQLISNDQRLAKASMMLGIPGITTNERPNWPIALDFGEVDFLVGWAGYNLFWETQAFGIPSLLLAGERKYDDQSCRTQVGDLSDAQIVDIVVEHVAAGAHQKTPNAKLDGAKQIQELVLQLAGC